MLLRLPGVLTRDEVARIRARIDAAGAWVDGNVTSGHQAAKAKRNAQLPEESEVARDCGEVVLAALARHPTFFSAVLPRQVYPPLFNRSGPGDTFGNHVDGAIRVHPPTMRRIRTDVSATLFLTDPDDYDGGELTIDATYGTQAVKLPAGDLIVYPATSVHRVTPITRGTRVSSFFWVESMVRDDAQRRHLFDMDLALIALAREVGGDHASLVTLTGCYHNLLRRWGDA